jgi:hypothetical protein
VNPIPPDPSARRAGAALFAVSLAALWWEILLTRIYSVTLYYHYAFMAVSVALFGMTLGAVMVYVRRPSAANRPVEEEMAALAALTGILMTAAMIIQLSLPMRFQGLSAPPMTLIRTYLLSALPFVPAGAFITLALTRFPQAGFLYAMDLAGAGMACVLLAPLVSFFGAPGAAPAAGSAALLGAAVLSPGKRPRAWAFLGMAAILLGLALVNRETRWIRVHGRPRSPQEEKILYERWGANSYIRVFPQTDTPFGWGLSPRRAGPQAPAPWYMLEIDSGAGTPLTSFGGDPAAVAFLKDDITAFAHHLRKDAEVLVIGAGGGRDVLTALAFKQKHVTGVDVNGDILGAVEGPFGDFTGHLDRRPDVRLVAEEGRSFLARAPERYDVIQASLVDTAAAAAAGAYAFVENSLYTTEAWRLFLQRLKPGGLLTFTRWYYGSAPWPVEIYRMTALAGAALRDTGVTEPWRHILLVRMKGAADLRMDTAATMIVSKDPLTEADLAAAESAAKALDFEIALSPRGFLDPVFSLILKEGASPDLWENFRLDVSPPTDDKPYFFFHGRMRDFRRESGTFGASAFNIQAVSRLRALALWTFALALLIAVVPPFLLISQKRWSPAADRRWAVTAPAYFALLGLAFMFVEIALMQRLGIFLGRPTYGFTVVLFGLLAASGLGSLACHAFFPGGKASTTWAVLACLPALLWGADPLITFFLKSFSGLPAAGRIASSLLVIVPAGFLMGFGVPAGLDAARVRNDDHAPWYWALNGAFSIAGSVAAMIACLGWGLRHTMNAGGALYALCAALLWSTGRGGRRP